MFLVHQVLIKIEISHLSKILTSLVIYFTKYVNLVLLIIFLSLSYVSSVFYDSI